MVEVRPLSSYLDEIIYSLFSGAGDRDMILFSSITLLIRIRVAGDQGTYGRIR